MELRPVVSVLCTTYNHEAYIRDALDGFVAQRTDFPFEVVVHDDASTDGTAGIVREYEQRYPQMVRVIYQTENQFTREKGRVSRLIFEATRGEFIALCEGDDYWIDPEKLQVQVDHLRAHPDQAFCFTNAYNEYDGGRREDYVRGWLNGQVPAGTLHQPDIVARNFIPTAGVLYRRERLARQPDEVRRKSALDWLLHVVLSSTGPFGYIDRISAVRRVHEGGVISMKDPFVKIDLNLQLLDEIEGLTDGRYNDVLSQRRMELHRWAIQYAVDNGIPKRGAKYLRAVMNDPQQRRSASSRELLRSALLIHAPALGRLFHRVRTGK